MTADATLTAPVAAHTQTKQWAALKFELGSKVFWVVCDRDGRLKETEENARLQASAPDMLAALKLARRSMIVSVTGISDGLTIPDIRQWIEQADTAIARAEGRQP